MLRSLFAGVSGLSANLAELDVIGNNIANSNTIGFKYGRVTFSEMLTQSLRSASRPVSGGRGGTNPQQIGLGTQVGSIDTVFNQGNFTTTGLKTDLALQGQGFFVLSDGLTQHFTRAGVFGLDADSYLVNPSTGLRVQGVMADANGVIPSGSFGDLVIDRAQVVPAQASDSIQLFGNLNADSDAMETVLQSNAFLVAATGDDTLTSLYGQQNGALNLHEGDRVSATVMINNNLISPPQYQIDANDTYDDLIAWLNDTFQNSEGIPLTFGHDASGALTVFNGSGDTLMNLALSVGGRANFNLNFQFPSTIPPGTTATTSDGENGQLRAPAALTDSFSQLYNEDGQSLDLDLSGGATTIQIGGTRGGEAITQLAMNVDGTTTVQDFLTQLQAAFRISSNPITIDDRGRLVMHGEVGTDNALGDVSITEARSDGATNPVLESSFSFLQTQEARDEQSFSVATTIYDSLGGEHTINFTFQKVSGLNEWIWQAEMEGNEEILLGQTGRVRFTDEGTVSNFSIDDGSRNMVIRPQPSTESGASLINLNIDYGTIGGLNGLTQFEGRDSLQAMADGFTSGSLVDFEIDQNGLVIGHFSNDTMRNLARVGLAMFSNPAGLTRQSNNTFGRSGNSGQALETFAGEAHGTTIVPGALESSNVDLAEQFTRLVIAQRAFQANARVITTGDQVMQELVSIIR